MKFKLLCGVLGSAIIITINPGSVSAQEVRADACASLAQVHAPHLTITSATSVNSPLTFGSGNGGVTVSTAFCRVIGTLAPASDSQIVFEVWLPPVANWNHKMQAVGNGGFAGSVNYRAMLPGLNRGYATMATDAGHVSDPANLAEDVTWAMGHPEKFIDYGYRAEHLTTLAAKQLIETYYGSGASHAYYTGCSAGGIQGVVELLRYPKDYDGYVIGDATPDHLGQEIGALWNALAASLANEGEALKPTHIALVHKAILQQCAGKDGGVSSDGFLTNPLACNFDVKTLQCGAGQDATTCLSTVQVAELAKIYQGPVEATTRKPILAGLTYGTESTWDRYFSGKKNPAGTERPWAGFMAYVAFSDPEFLSQQKYLNFNFGTDLASIRQKKLSGETLDSIFNVRNRDLDQFKAAGGKVIQYHGWDDANIPALEAVHLFDGVVADQAQRHRLSAQQALNATEQFYRLFMVPGMGHCSGGAGPSVIGQPGQRALKPDAQHDMLSALELWVEKGVAPEIFIGSRVDAKTGAVDMTRPICAYPKVPTWNGTGNANDASSFVCKEH